MITGQLKKPDWLKIKYKREKSRDITEEILKELSLHTVCEEANCPNIGECFGRKTATFMISGKYCTRNCTFCNVQKNTPEPLDPDEPLHIAGAVKKMQLKYVVITSVTRDDLADGGAQHFANVIRAIKDTGLKVLIEVLIPDFKGDLDALSKVVNAVPDVINHNVETVPRLYLKVRPMAVYNRSLEVLSNVKLLSKKILTKSGIMVGLGEEEQEILEVFNDLRKADCDLLTIGQYLAPSRKHYPTIEYVHPDIFERYKKFAFEAGFKNVASAPLVRSSYLAEKMFEAEKSI
ncbi:MAG: lipoyl synthase [Actinobacteria bacterium]|nr:lipoyl synthase [Actinomycetota bacterium]